MSSPAQIVRYLRECYEADNRETAIFNLRSDKVEHLQFLSQGGQFLSGLLEVVPIDRESAVAAQKAADLYQTEKTLVFGGFIVAGQLGKSTRSKVFAPLIYYPALGDIHGPGSQFTGYPRGFGRAERFGASRAVVATAPAVVRRTPR